MKLSIEFNTGVRKHFTKNKFWLDDWLSNVVCYSIGYKFIMIQFTIKKN